MTYTVLTDQQSIFDIAVLVYGDVAGVHQLLDDNPTLGLTDRLQPGQTLQIQSEAINPRMVTYLTDFEPPQTIQAEDKPEGIDYWNLNEYEIQ